MKPSVSHTLSMSFARFALARMAALFFLAGLLLVAAPASAHALYGSDSGGDMVVFGGQHQVIKEGQEVHGDLVVIGGSADVYGKVDGDAAAIGGRIYIAPKGHVNGSLVNLGGVIDNESNVPQSHGVIPPIPPIPMPTMPEIPRMPMPEEASAPWFAPDWSAFFFIDALLTLIAFLLFPGLIRNVSTHLIDNPLMAGMLGFFSPIIFVLVIIALAITIIGIPLIPLAVIVTIVGYLVGKAAIAEFLGNRIFDATKHARPQPIVAVLIGVGILFLISVGAGWIGIVFYFCIGALAIGASLPLLRYIQPPRHQPTITPPPAATTQFSPPVDPAHTGPPAVP